jgi:KaiC/GvpD/RAD55 family RecA-like ATPase
MMSTPSDDDVVYVKTVESPNAVTTALSDGDNDEGKFYHEEEIRFLKTVQKELDYKPDKTSTSHINKAKTNSLTSVKDVFGPYDRDT